MDRTPPDGTTRPPWLDRHRADPPECPLLERLADRAGFAEVTLVDEPTSGPFGRIVRARARRDGRTRPVALRLFRRPDDRSDGFADSLAAQLERWRDRVAGPGVVALLAAGTDPRPWGWSAPLDHRLSGFGPCEVGRAVDDGLTLARTLAGLHDRGVVHAGIEPRTVCYDDCDRPRLDAVGLVDVYRRHADPATVLDPRYAAPEHHDPERGIVDRSTDVYQLGTVLFRMVTGVAPFDGSPATIREAVLGSEPVPAPSSVRPAVPEALDRIVRRATRPEPRERYDSAATLADELAGVGRRERVR